MEKLEQTDDDLLHALELMQKHGALADTLDRARHYGAMARDALGLFGDSPVKRAMVEAIDFAIERAH
jgi:octaprenyl-diphosphate synthase